MPESLRILREDAANGGRDSRLVEAFCRIPADSLHQIGSGVFFQPLTRMPLSTSTSASIAGAV
jgi:hypothetical protein